MRSTALKITFAVTLFLGVSIPSLQAQTADKINVVTTAVPFFKNFT